MSTETAPPVQPKFVVEDSPLKASITTVFSLFFFGITFAGAVLKLASAHDLNGIRALFMREETIGWLTTVAPLAWAAWRTRRTWLKTLIGKEIAEAAPDAIAMPKTAAAALASEPPPPATRARETTTRLVPLHRGAVEKPLEPQLDVVEVRGNALGDVAELAVPESTPQPEVGEQCDRPPAGWYCTRVAGHDGPCAALPDPEPRIPGDALSMPPANR